MEIFGFDSKQILAFQYICIIGSFELAHLHAGLLRNEAYIYCLSG